MKFKAALAAIALSLTPGLAIAQGCNKDEINVESASSCIAGSSWDEVKGACVANPTS